MKDLLKSLKEKQLIAGEQHMLLKHNFAGMTKELFENQMKNTGKAIYGHRYSFKTKQFALTLHYYSPKAYDCTQIVGITSSIKYKNMGCIC